MKAYTLVFGLLSLVSIARGVENVTPLKAADLAKAGLAEIIDVRERSELEATGMAAPALWLAKTEVDGTTKIYKAFLKQIVPEKRLIFYCRTGSRARAVAEHFEALGFQTANMGGFEGWKRAGLPIRKFNAE